MNQELAMNTDDELVKKECRFIARRAVLYNPEGKTVARADKIIVPVDNPSQYKATGKKTN